MNNLWTAIGICLIIVVIAILAKLFPDIYDKIITGLNMTLGEIAGAFK
jgi:hypothetical protein